MEKKLQKMAKNDPNDLKIWHMMYLGVFYWFPKFWKFSLKIARFSGKKFIFFRRLGKNLKKKLWRKVYAFLGKWSSWPKNWYKCTLGSLLQYFDLFFWIFGVFAILRVPICAKTAIFVSIFGDFQKNLPKIAILAHIGTRKMAKTPNIQKNKTKYCSKDPKVHLYQFVGQLDHFPRNA